MSYVVTHEQWLDSRKALLSKEKEFSRLRDELSRERRQLPWEAVDKTYQFDGPEGRQTLAELFDGRSQLMIYHFMLGPGWAEGCKSCSFLADHFDGANIHLPHRDVTFLAVSRAPLEEIQAYQKRMGWRFKWVSSFGGDFNYDYNVSFTKEQIDSHQVAYNYGLQAGAPGTELPGLSCFFRDPDGRVYHTYSTYGRGLDILLGAYNFLDLAPKGRDEDSLAFTMAWVRHHDKYGDGSYKVDPKAGYQNPEIIEKKACCSTAAS